MTLSNSQIEKLGKRLRDNEITEADLALLDEFRQTYSEIDRQAYAIVQGALESQADLTLTKRKRKTQQSIVDKLRRQKNLRLPQMQDMAGCRIVLKGGDQQAQIINHLLLDAFNAQQWIVQSKNRNSEGYRAIHIIAKQGKQFYEIQLRTYAQDVWANTVEGAADKDNTLKYGGSEQEQERMQKLKALSDAFAELDSNAHTGLIEDYHQKIAGAIQHVLSN